MFKKHKRLYYDAWANVVLTTYQAVNLALYVILMLQYVTTQIMQEVPDKHVTIIIVIGKNCYALQMRAMSLIKVFQLLC